MSKQRSKKARQVRKALRQARAVITPYSHWTSQTEARNVTGAVISWSDPDASKFCAVGAVHYVVNSMPDFADLTADEKHLLYRDAVRVLDRCAESKAASIVSLNDSGARGEPRFSTILESKRARHKLVLDAFDCAVDKADVMFPEVSPVEMRAEAGSIGTL